MNFEGRHITLDVRGLQQAHLQPEYVKKLLTNAVRLTGAKIVGDVEHRFQPQGYSLVLLLAESHASAHTWPEENGIMFDIFTCGTLEPEPFIKHITSLLHPRYVRIERHTRGT